VIDVCDKIEHELLEKLPTRAVLRMCAVCSGGACLAKQSLSNLVVT
jgi:hypothetical protein